MTSHTLTLHLPKLYQPSPEADVSSLGVLRAAIVVVQHLLTCRSECDGGTVGQTADMVNHKLTELICLVEVYERRLEDRERSPSYDSDPTNDF